MRAFKDMVLDAYALHAFLVAPVAVDAGDDDGAKSEADDSDAPQQPTQKVRGCAAIRSWERSVAAAFTSFPLFDFSHRI